jgi:hypothetical protein
MPPVGLEPAISACERSQTYALDSTATGKKECLVYLNCRFYCRMTVLYVRNELLIKCVGEIGILAD